MARKPASSGSAAWYCADALNHDNVAYAVGDAVEIDDERGEALRALGVLSRVAPVADPVPDSPETDPLA